MEISRRVSIVAALVLLLVAAIILAVFFREAAYDEHRIPHLPHYVPSCAVIADTHHVDVDWPPLKIDGVVLFEGHRVILTAQDMKTDNGIYVMTGEKKLLRSRDTLRDHARLYVDSRKTTFVVCYDRSVAPDQESNPGIDVVAGGVHLLNVVDGAKSSVLNDQFEWAEQFLDQHAWTVDLEDPCTLVAPRVFACLSQCQVRLDNGQLVRVLDTGFEYELVVAGSFDKTRGRCVTFSTAIEELSLL